MSNIQRVDHGHGSESSMNEMSLSGRIDNALSDPHVRPEVLCDLIQEITAFDAISNEQDDEAKTKLAYLRKNNRLNQLLFLASLLEEISDRIEQDVNDPDFGFIPVYREAADMARYWYDESQQIDHQIQVANERVSKIIPDDVYNTFTYREGHHRQWKPR